MTNPCHDETENDIEASAMANNESESTVENESNHVKSTAALCLCTLVHGYLLVNVFPYSGYMAMALVPGVTEETAGPYAGLIASAFMAGRTCSAYPWGTLADTYGRKFVLVASLLLSGIFSLLFGISQSLPQAMLWRFLLGFCNSIVSTTKTAVTELARGDEQREKRAMSLVVGMRGWGLLVSPALGGLLADPLRQYPKSDFFRSITPMLSTCPFLVPNIVGTALCFLAVIAVIYCIEETISIENRRSPFEIPTDVRLYVRNLVRPLCTCHGQISEQELQSLFSRNATDTAIRNSFTKGTGSGGMIQTLWSRRSTRLHLMSYWTFSFLVASVDEAFPLFCISNKGGLGLSESSIGTLLSSAGLLFAFLQYAVYTMTVEATGLYPSMAIGSALGVVPVVLIPVSLQLNTNSHNHFNATATGLSWTNSIFLSLLLASCKIFSCIFFTSMAIALNKTVPLEERGAVNGLAVVGASIAKGLGPILAGTMVSWSFSSFSFPAESGSIVTFSTLGILGMVVAYRSTMLAPRAFS